MDPEVIFAALFGVGGSGALAGIWTILQSFRKGKFEKEETLIQRLDKSNRSERESREEAERDAARYRRQRIRAQDQAAEFRRMLIMKGIPSIELEPLEEFND